MKTNLKYALAPLALAAFAATPAAAQTYVAVSGGLSLPADSENSGEFTSEVPATEDFGSIPNGTDLGWNTDFDNGSSFSAHIGYALPMGVRVEAEAAYTRYDVSAHNNLLVGGANIDGVDSAVLTRGPASGANPTVGDVLDDGQGNVSNFGLFGNVYYDLPLGGTFKPYVGAGVGYQWTSVDYRPSGVEVGEDDDGAFAYQLMAGANFGLTDSVELFGQYTYRDSFDDAEIPLTLLPANLGVETQQSILSAGVRVRFGG